MKNIFILLIAASVVVSCSSGSGTDKKTELENLKKEATAIQDKIAKLEEQLKDTTADDAKQIAITVMQPATFEHYIEVQARVDGDENVDVSPEMPGTVTRINVKAGDHVSKGTVLAELDAATTQKGVEEAQNQLDFTNTIYQKQKALWEQKVGSEVQYLTAKNNYDAASKRVATMREQLSMSKIKSPIDGTVDGVDIKIGQSVAPGMGGIQVVNLRNLKVKAEVAEAYVSKVKSNNPVKIVFPDVNKEISTKLTYSGKAIDKLNRTFSVEAALSAKEDDLHPNMVAVLKIADYTKANAFFVPVNLIQTNGDESYLFVAEKSGNKEVAKKRIVKTGQSYNGTVEIVEGLKEGDRVITTGYQDLLDNETVKL